MVNGSAMGGNFFLCQGSINFGEELLDAASARIVGLLPREVLDSVLAVLGG